MMNGFAGDGESSDVSQFRATMQAVEGACSAIQMHIDSAAAEATIIALHQSPKPYQCCRFILENSELANARFQAAGAIRDAAIREWGVLTDDDKKSLIFFCLWFVMKHATATDGYVQNKVSAVAAQLMKRGWLEFTAYEKERFLSEQVKNAVIGIHGADAQFVGINFLESLVSEFSLPTSSAMGLPAEFHEKCKSSLEQEYLQKFYCWAQDAALGVTNRIIECNGMSTEERVCSAALHLMFQILNWEFKGAAVTVDTSDNRIRHDTALLRKFEHTLVEPGPLWRDVLISSGHIAWLLGLYETLKKKYSYDVLWIDSHLAVCARQLIVQLSSLTGSIFPSDNGQTQERHLLQILCAVVQWIDHPSAIVESIRNGQSESEMIDGCHALLSIATLTSTLLFDNLLKSIRSYGTLGFLSTLTCEIIKALEAGNNEEETWCSDALDILLEIWNVLLGRTDFNKTVLSREGIDGIVILFNTMMESRLKAAAASAFDEDDDSEHFHASIAARDERFSSYALIARTVARVAIPLLVRLFAERFSLLYQGKGATDPTCTLEELYWLLLITGHVLTDAGQGETVMIPEALQAQFVDVVDAAQHPIVVLSWSVINFAERCLDPDMRAAFFSPRLMEAIIWFLSRWVDTYLMPTEYGKTYSCKPSCHVAEPAKNVLLIFAGDEKGKSLLDIIVHILLVIFTSFPGEIELQTLTCQQLLPALVRRKNVRAHLVSLDSWHNLSNAFVNERILFSLPTRLQRSLAEALVSSVSALKESETSNRYVRDLMGPMATCLTDLFTKDNLKIVSQQPDVILMVSCLLERMRGATRATESRTQKAIFDMAVSVMDSLLTLLEVYKDQSAVVYLLLKFVVDLVDTQVVFLTPKDTAVLVSFCMRLLQLYSSHNIGKISLSLSASLLNEAKTEKYKDLRALLQLLTHLCSKDLIDFSSASPEEECTNIAEVVFLGLHIVTPLISFELLKYPKLCKNYFELLSHMLEVYPEMVIQLNMEAFKHIMGTLDFGLHQQDIDVVDMCLRSVNALASYHNRERTRGKEGLGAYAVGFHDIDGTLQEGCLCYFLRLLLQLILFDDFRMELAGSAADALLPLILCEQDLYQRLVNEIIERQPNPTLKSRLANALLSLTTSNQLSPSLDRVSRQRFRKNLSKFLIDVSGFLRIR